MIKDIKCYNKYIFIERKANDEIYFQNSHLFAVYIRCSISQLSYLSRTKSFLQ